MVSKFIRLDRTENEAGNALIAALLVCGGILLVWLLFTAITSSIGGHMDHKRSQHEERDKKREEAHKNNEPHKVERRGYTVTR
jgi:type VI protein secretion system component VasK